MAAVEQIFEGSTAHLDAYALHRCPIDIIYIYIYSDLFFKGRVWFWILFNAGLDFLEGQTGKKAIFRGLVLDPVNVSPNPQPC